METEHTPTPWIYSPTGSADSQGDIVIMADLGDGRIESIGRLWNSHGRAERNAKFIFLACNVHEELVAALQEIAMTSLNMPAAWNDPDSWVRHLGQEELLKVIHIAVNALAKCEKGE